ncbi:MAG: energy transducer TonB [Sphingomonas sp.]
MPAKLLAFMLLLGPAPAAAQDFGEWQVGMGTQHCGARMRKRDGAEVRLSRSTTDPGTIVRVTPPTARDRDGVDPFGTYRDLKIEGHTAWGETASDGTGGAAAPLTADEFARMLAAGVVRVTGSGPAVEIPLPPGMSVDSDLEACLVNLRVAQRGSGEPQAVPPRPWSDLGLIVRDAPDGLQHFSEGRMRVRLTVAAQGHILACAVIESSGNSHVDKRSCDLLRARAHFTPAADMAGRPTLGSYEFSIAWKT